MSEPQEASGLQEVLGEPGVFLVNPKDSLCLADILQILSPYLYGKSMGTSLRIFAEYTKRPKILLTAVIGQLLAAGLITGKPVQVGTGGTTETFYNLADGVTISLRIEKKDPPTRTEEKSS